jgi:alanyl aminopeptidase
MEGVSVFAIAVGFAVCSCGAPPREPTRVARPVVTAPPAPPVEVPAPRDDGRLPSGVRPTAYRIELSVDPTTPRFTGRVTSALVLEHPARAVVMHGRSLAIRAATFTAGGATFPARASFRPAAHGKGEADELVFETAALMPAGTATLVVDYDAPFSEGLNGLYKVTKGDKAYAFTQFEPVGARLAFPCFDEPDAKVPVELAVTVRSGDVALSNMPVRSEKKSADGARVTVEFERSPPLPTYLVALAVGPLEVTERLGATVPLRLVATPGRSALGSLALSVAADHLKVLEEYFGTKYPYPKLDLVAVPDFSSGAMENAGLVTFREERLLVDDSAPTGLKRALAGTVAHELAHMWFGDLVTMRWWDDIWLNEGFATWMATRVLDTWRPEMRAGIEALGNTASAMHADTLETARRVRQPVRSTTEALEAFDSITYTKGAALLSMVERWLGADVFRSGVRRYLSDHRFANATGEDLFNALALASNTDVPTVFRSFTEQTGLPLVEIEPCAVRDGHPELRVVQTPYRPLGAAESVPEKSWQFPVCVHAGGKTRADEPICTLVSAREARLTLPGTTCPVFVHPNADQAGYYHAKTDSKTLATLAALPAATLSPRERVGLLTDAWALVESGALEANDFIELARKFRGDSELAVWEQVTDALDELSEDAVSDADQPAFGAMVRSLLGPEAAALGWEARKKDGDAERMRRRIVLSTLGAVGRDPAVLARARELADRWLASSSSVDGDRASIAVPLAARYGNAALFDRLVAKLAADPTPADRFIAVSALAQFSDPALVSRVLELVLSSAVRAQDQVYVYAGLFSRNEARRAAFETLAAKVDEFLGRMPPFARRRIVHIVARSCSKEETDRAHVLLAPRLASIEGADRGFAQAEEEGARCAAFRAYHGPRLTAYLARPR